MYIYIYTYMYAFCKTPMDSMSHNLPVLIVAEWSDVDEAFLEKANPKP